MEWNSLNNFERADNPRIIPVKFDDNQPRGLGEDVVLSELLTDDGSQ